jgi:hypothetical protein
MREIRPSGSEGGVALTPPFLPLSRRGRDLSQPVAALGREPHASPQSANGALPSAATRSSQFQPAFEAPAVCSPAFRPPRHTGSCLTRHTDGLKPALRTVGRSDSWFRCAVPRFPSVLRAPGPRQRASPVGSSLVPSRRDGCPGYSAAVLWLVTILSQATIDANHGRPLPGPKPFRIGGVPVL